VIDCCVSRVFGCAGSDAAAGAGRRRRRSDDAGAAAGAGGRRWRKRERVGRLIPRDEDRDQRIRFADRAVDAKRHAAQRRLAKEAREADERMRVVDESGERAERHHTTVDGHARRRRLHAAQLDADEAHADGWQRRVDQLHEIDGDRIAPVQRSVDGAPPPACAAHAQSILGVARQHAADGAHAKAEAALIHHRAALAARHRVVERRVGSGQIQSNAPRALNVTDGADDRRRRLRVAALVELVDIGLDRVVARARRARETLATLAFRRLVAHAAGRLAIAVGHGATRRQTQRAQKAVVARTIVRRFTLAAASRLVAIGLALELGTFVAEIATSANTFAIFTSSTTITICFGRCLLFSKSQQCEETTLTILI
jgi:hypothetical protein